MSQEKKVEEAFASSNPILYLDLGLLVSPDQKKVRGATEVTEAFNKIVTAKMLEDLENRIRENTRIAGDSSVIGALKVRLLKRREEQQKQDTNYSPLSNKELNDHLQGAGSINENESGPAAARRSFQTHKDTQVLVLTHDPEKFAEKKNVRAFKFGEEGQDQEREKVWNMLTGELNKAKEEVFRSTIGSVFVGGRSTSIIAALMGPPLEVELAKQRAIEESVKARRNKGEKEKTLAEQITALRKEKSFGVIFIPATDDDGNPIRSKRGEPILDIIEMKDGAVRNVIINDPDGTRKGQGVNMKAYKIQDGSEMQQNLDKLLDKVQKSDSEKDLQAGLKAFAKGNDTESKGRLEAPWVTNEELGKGLDQALGYVADAIRKNNPEFESPSFMKEGSELSPDERLEKFENALNSLGEENKAELIKEIEEKGEESALKVDDQGKINVDFDKFIQELAQIANEGMQLNVGMAGVVTRSKALGYEVAEKLRRQESDLFDTPSQSVSSPNETPRPAGVGADLAQQSTNAARVLVAAGARLEGQGVVGGNKFPDGRHLKGPKPVETQPGANSTKRNQLPEGG